MQSQVGKERRNKTTTKKGSRYVGKICTPPPGQGRTNKRPSGAPQVRHHIPGAERHARMRESFLFIYKPVNECRHFRGRGNSSQEWPGVSEKLKINPFAVCGKAKGL